MLQTLSLQKKSCWLYDNILPIDSWRHSHELQSHKSQRYIGLPSFFQRFFMIFSCNFYQDFTTVPNLCPGILGWWPMTYIGHVMSCHDNTVRPLRSDLDSASPVWCHGFDCRWGSSIGGTKSWRLFFTSSACLRSGWYGWEIQARGPVRWGALCLLLEGCLYGTARCSAGTSEDLSLVWARLGSDWNLFEVGDLRCFNTLLPTLSSFFYLFLVSNWFAETMNCNYWFALQFLFSKQGLSACWTSGGKYGSLTFSMMRRSVALGLTRPIQTQNQWKRVGGSYIARYTAWLLHILFSLDDVPSYLGWYMILYNTIYYDSDIIWFPQWSSLNSRLSAP